MKTAEEIIEVLIFSDEMVLDTVGEDIRFVSANDAIRAMIEYASQSQGNKDAIIEKQGELIDALNTYSTQVALMWNKDIEDDESKDLKNRLWENVKKVRAELASLQSGAEEATKCKHENWVWVQKLKQCSDCGYTWFDKAEGETPSECKECRHQNSENCNTCDIINPQFR